MGSSASASESKPSGDQKPPTLYMHPFSAPCRAVLMAAGAAGIKLNLKKVDMLKGEHQTEAYLKINPDHTVPTLVDGSLKLWESRAIMQYLMNQYGDAKNTLYPRDPVQRATIDRLLQYDQGTAYRNISEYVYPQLFQKLDADPEKAKAVEKVFDYLENILKTQSHVAGSHLSLADISLTAGLSLLEISDWPFAKWPAVAIWRETIRKQVWYEKANEGLTRFKDIGLNLE